MQRATTALLAAAALLAVAVCGLSASASGQPAGNMAIDWNAIASTAIMAAPPQGAGQPPHAAPISLAMVQGAVYDAVNAIDGGHQPYLVAALEPVYDASLASIPDGSPKDEGVEVGEATATAMLTARANDGRFGPFKFVEGFDPGEWRLAPPQGDAKIVAKDPAPWVGFVKPFL